MILFNKIYISLFSLLYWFCSPFDIPTGIQATHSFNSDLDVYIPKVGIPNFDDVNIPSFFNDITKYNVINRKIKNYYKLAKEFDSPEMAKIYLIDVKRLYEERDKI